MEGQIAEHPLGELIREISHTGLSGALRLSREPAKIVVYFESGDTVFAASNLRAHRLREALKRNGLTDSQLNKCPATASDQKLADVLIKNGSVTREALQA